MAKPTFASVNVGDEIPPVSAPMSQEKMNTYADVSGDYNPINVDVEFAKNTMFKGTIAHGVLSLNYIYQALIEWSGGSWPFNGGGLDIAFINPVRPGDTVTAKGKVIEKKTEDGKNKVFLDMWAENQNGQKCIVGKATAVLT